MKEQIFIAEVKPKSPFGFENKLGWNELFDLANEHGDWLSIHTDERWGGSFDDVALAKALTDKPILAKGIHKTDDDIKRAVDAGADFVLVVGRNPGVYLQQCLVEVGKIQNFGVVPKNAKAVWNQRNLGTGKQQAKTFADARAEWGGWLAQASFIKTPADVSPHAQAYIVGEHLPEFTSALERAK